MKKFLAVVLCLLMVCLACTALAVEKQPGETVTITLSVSGNSENAVTTRVKVSGDDSVFEFVSASLAGDKAGAAPKKLNANYNVKSADLESPLSGELGTMTLRVKAGAAPGEYAITVSPSGTYDGDGNKVSISVSGGMTVVIPAPTCEHAWDAGVDTTPATCDKAGVKTFTCTKCGTTKTEEIPAPGHKFDDGVQTKAPTCKEEGITTFTCSVCGATETKPIDKTDKHTWDEGVETKKMTCLEDGEKTFTCTVCGEKDVTVIKAPGKHTYSEADAKIEKEPTCTEDGKGSFTCTVCGTKIDGDVLPALGHDKTETVTKEATCGADGEKTITCSRCDFKEVEKIPATGEHKNETKVTTEATCGKAGVETTTCTVCGKTETKEIPATGKHTYEEKVTKEATCTEKGEKTFTCSVCGDKYTEEIAAKGHTPGADLKEQKPTCTKPGYKYYTCSVCGAEVKDAEIPATGEHIYEIVEEVAATCEKDGKRVSKCTYEGCTETKTEVLPKLGHNFGEWVVDEENNKKTRVCGNCGVVETKSLATHYTMTVCTYGIRFRDLQNPITKEWYMFTPIDLSVEGEQTIDLIAGNMHEIGKATVLVKDGKVTVTTKVNSTRNIAYKEEFLTFVPALADLTALDFEAMTNYAYGEEISIEEALGGDTKVLLLMRNRAWYPDNANGVNAFKGKGKAYNAYVEELKALMD